MDISFKKKKKIDDIIINNKNTVDKKVVNILKNGNIIFLLLILLFIVIKYGLFYFENKSLIRNMELLNNNILVLNNMNNELDKMSSADKLLIEKDLLFNNKKFRKDLMDVQILDLSIIEKSGKKNSSFSLLKVNLNVNTLKEKDFRKFLLLLSLNQNIYKIENISKANGDKITINLIYKINNNGDIK